MQLRLRFYYLFVLRSFFRNIEIFLIVQNRPYDRMGLKEFIEDSLQQFCVKFLVLPAILVIINRMFLHSNLFNLIFIFLVVYEGLKGHFKKSKRNISTNSNSQIPDTLWNPIISGGCAGIAAWLPCYPQDVIKSVIQSSPTKLTLYQAIKHIHKTSGYRGFFKGFGPTMLRAFPANSATFLGYELVMKTLKPSPKTIN